MLQFLLSHILYTSNLLETQGLIFQVCACLPGLSSKGNLSSLGACCLDTDSERPHHSIPTNNLGGKLGKALIENLAGD